MEQEKQIIMTDQLTAHITVLQSKMSVMGYQKHTIRCYSKVWESLLDYVKSKEVQAFTSEYSHRFITETYGVYYDSKSSRCKINRPMEVLLDYIRLGVIIRQKNLKKDFTAGYKQLFEGFLTSQVERGLSANSIIVIRSRLFRLENFLLDSGIKQFCEITRAAVSLYIESFITHSTGNASCSLRDFGRLCDYAAKSGFHAESFSNMIPRVKNLRRQKFPHMFTAEEIKRLLETVDRNNPQAC